MQFVREVSFLRSLSRSCVVSIGRFDGVHLGHHAVLRRLIDVAQRRSAAAIVLNRFDASVPTLGCLHQRMTDFAAAGVDAVCILRDGSRRKEASDTALIESLVRCGKVSVLVLGSEHATEIADVPLEIEVVPVVLVDATPVTSAAIRSFVAAGVLSGAEKLLGRPYAVGGRIVHGLRRGRQLGFPTANVRTVNVQLPPNGVYAVRFRVGTRTYDGVANLGVNPTFADVRRSLEVHIFDFSDAIYGLYAEVIFVDHLRDERKFSGVDALMTQIRDDCVEARRRLS